MGKDDEDDGPVFSGQQVKKRLNAEKTKRESDDE